MYLNNFQINDRLKLLDLAYKYNCTHLSSMFSMIDYMKFISMFIDTLNSNNRILYIDKVYGSYVYDYLFNLNNNSNILNINTNKIISNSMGFNHTLGIVAGRAIVNKNNTFIINSGDSCLNNGNLFEALTFIGSNKLNNIILLIDNNNSGATGDLKFSINSKDYFNSLNWNCIFINGHYSISQFYKELDTFPNYTLPTVILFKTIKGYGISNHSHSINLNIDNNYNNYKDELKKQLYDLYER
jgi:hypothetical protein